MALRIQITGQGIERMRELSRLLSSPSRVGKAYVRALKHTGRIAQTRVGRALARQTGLKVRTTRKALSRPILPTINRLEYTLRIRGGDISLKHFGARETRRGVSANPFGRRRVFAGTFMKGGLFPARRILNLGGHVFEPTSGKRWGRPFRKVSSGVVLPTEAVTGASAAAFRDASGRLGPRVQHELRRISKGALT